MSDFSNALSVSASGLKAQAQRLVHVSENIANADTPGYRRKTVSFETAFAGSEGTGAVEVSLPRAASDEENALIARARALLSSYSRSETMIRAGLYAEGSDPELDQAIRIWPDLDGFLADKEAVSVKNSFARLGVILRRAGTPVVRASSR